METLLSINSVNSYVLHTELQLDSHPPNDALALRTDDFEEVPRDGFLGDIRDSLIR